MNHHILIPNNLNQTAIDLLERTDGITVTAPGKMTRDETLSAVPDAHALIIRSATKADAELLNAAGNLKVVARAGAGVDNIDLGTATARGAVVMNTPDGNTVSTAEYTFGLILALSRHIPKAHTTLLAGNWDRKQFMGTELRGKVLGLVGFGRVGRAVAKRALSFEMTVIAYDPYIPPDIAADFGVAMVDLGDLYRCVDYISLHSLVTDKTCGMINADSIAQMKEGVRIINAARGTLINEADLAAAIKAGYVAGAALDVYTTEPPPDNHPLLRLEGVIHTPHLAASTFDAQITVAIEATQLVLNALLRGEYENVVNSAVLRE